MVFILLAALGNVYCRAKRTLGCSSHTTLALAAPTPAVPLLRILFFVLGISTYVYWTVDGQCVSMGYNRSNHHCPHNQGKRTTRKRVYGCGEGGHEDGGCDGIRYRGQDNMETDGPLQRHLTGTADRSSSHKDSLSVTQFSNSSNNCLSISFV